MKYPMTASIIVVQLDPESDVVAYVTYGAKGGVTSEHRRELKLGTLSDAVDVQMWMQMMTATVCDLL